MSDCRWLWPPNALVSTSELGNILNSIKTWFLWSDTWSKLINSNSNTGVSHQQGFLPQILNFHHAQSCLYSFPSRRKRTKAKTLTCLGELGYTQWQRWERIQTVHRCLPLICHASCNAKEHLGHISEGISEESCSWSSQWIAELHTKDSQTFTEEQSEESSLFWACNIREPVSSHFTWWLG